MIHLINHRNCWGFLSFRNTSSEYVWAQGYQCSARVNPGKNPCEDLGVRIIAFLQASNHPIGVETKQAGCTSPGVLVIQCYTCMEQATRQKKMADINIYIINVSHKTPVHIRVSRWWFLKGSLCLDLVYHITNILPKWWLFSWLLRPQRTSRTTQLLKEPVRKKKNHNPNLPKWNVQQECMNMIHTLDSSWVSPCWSRRGTIALLERHTCTIQN